MWTLFSVELNVCSQILEVRFWPTGAHCRGTAMYGPFDERCCKSRILWHLQGLVHKMEASLQTVMWLWQWGREQLHVQSCAPAPLSCLHFGLNTYSQNQDHNDSQKGRSYQLWKYRVEKKARQGLIRGWKSQKKSWQESIREEQAILAATTCADMTSTNAISAAVLEAVTFR